MEQRNVGHYFDPENGTDWQIVEWGTTDNIRNIEENRLTQSGIDSSERTTFAITFPNGDVSHLTWGGPLPDDLDALVDYWTDSGSL